MADEVVIPGSGQEDAGSDQASSEVTSEPWAELGLDGPEAAIKVLKQYKEDLSKLKPEARKAKELETELAKYRQAEEERKTAEMSELERQQAALQKAKQDQEQLQAELDRTKKGIVYERTVAQRLAQYDETDRELLRELYDAKATDFGDEDELAELLDAIDKKWKAHLDGLGDKSRPEVGGGTRHSSRSASKDGKVLADTMAKGGVKALVAEKFGRKG